MYMIIGLQHDRRQCLVATPASAGEAMDHFLASLRHYPNVLIQSNGETLDGVELYRRALEERDAASS
jgi:hypothetical protein